MNEVPRDEMSQDRVKLLSHADDIVTMDPAQLVAIARKDMVALIEVLAQAAGQCPRIGCATCSFMSKHEQAQSVDVGTGGG